MRRSRAASLFFTGALALSCVYPTHNPKPAPTVEPPCALPNEGPLKISKMKYPETARIPVIDHYFDTSVVDDYRWLEDPSAPEVQQWIATQQQLARGHLDAIPGRDTITQRVTELLASPGASYWGLSVHGNTLFLLEDAPPKQQPFLITLSSAEDLGSRRVLLDPNTLDASGSTTIDFFVPSRDGSKVAVSLSTGGTESGSVHVYDVKTGKELGDLVPRVQGGTAGGSVAWDGAGTGFWYTRYPHPGERPEADLNFYQEVWFHRLGSKLESDRRELGEDFPRIAETELKSSPDGKYVMAMVANGDGGEYAFYLHSAAGNGATGKWHKIASFADKIVHGSFGPDGSLYLLSNAGAPRGKILRVDPKKPQLASAEVVVPESTAVIVSMEVTQSRLYVLDLIGGPSQLRAFEINARGPAKPLANVPLLPTSTVSGLERVGADDLLLQNESFTVPPAWFHYRAKEGTSSKTALFQSSPAAFDDTEVERTECTSKDGTKVPLNILRKKGTPLDGLSPTLLYGYGGYGVSLSPRFSAIRRLWLDQGGVWVIANLRGGGELGEEWHLAGNLTKKQNVFDDFAACAEHLIRTKVTSSSKLAIMGGSNGGLLMGAALTQHPELYKAVVARVGIYDMLRVELTPNGAFNVTEFGTVKDRAQFDALYRYSPLHNVKDGTPYPAVLFMTGANDPRVEPYNSRKMTARLQAASSGNGPILLRTSADTGHGQGTPLNAEVAENVDIYSFLFEQLGVAAR